MTFEVKKKKKKKKKTQFDPIREKNDIKDKFLDGRTDQKKADYTRAARLDDGGDSLTLELGARIELLEQLRVLAHLATCAKCVTPCRLELQGGPGRHARLRSLRQWLGRNG